ncbi:carboxylating nicotinate-nucleotide diphosphorylase [Nocardioides mangrovicus]|uniref:Nicotinate-nucleotide pyrophosphorylase [carboxylating] n=1 Tax=Nocardioides mangrovicus TaxID=2478913 RepID=A0A3L8P6G9_9ACTN|nr:carboxylating nicotinate-nucleotide diphosphorylase [Nocardioides mangrovicus]RLV50572.1 carboxylating nicotinate-nucleotide diphosphorylase [Nocardioides mangrovicus]
MDLDALLAATLAEDLGDAGDLTSLATVPADAVLRVGYVTRQPGVVCGLQVVEALCPGLVVDASDGDRVEAGRRLAVWEAPAREVLRLERTSLNLLGHLSGVATATRAWVDAVEGTGARIRDTRKTLPLLRDLQKYAVRCGGGVNHRAGLYDAILIKDNHVAAAGGVGAALDAAYAAHPRGTLVVQVEVDSLDQLDEALDHGAEQVLLDNFSLADLREAVRRRPAGVMLEASGGLRLENARAVASTRVDYLAVGALTHSVVVLDVGLDVV